ncbi:acyltransferase [Bacillus thuringiensis]|uniref:Galactoside O-acetyltransferase n=2 Tax=Bacillus cereus group TaxID=86661 RepID=A0A9X6UQY8_BACCE|nr:MULTISPECIES: acyltransferase [Bacillus]KAB2377977.1 acyltransferase [Bacillus sp. RM2(2019)]KXY56252.1 galactoside O-acetyltransferase [Bacillus cereus]MCC6082524.1 acyltransferase [Bacillus thuringiensis]MED3352512.1 acyltransferase [Bacillus thuringiensis]MEE3959190.1 acyltransferase [Bacillus thuringiensis]
MNSFYSQEELKKIGFLSVGKNVLVSKKASIYNPGAISVGNHVRIDDFCILSGKITIGSYSHISAYTALYGGEVGIEMHDFANISAKTIVYAVLDDFSGNTLMGPTVPNQYRNVKAEKVILKKHVIIGANSIIFPNVTVGEGTAVGAMSMVKESLDDWYIYAGVPVRKVKPRQKKMLELEIDFLKSIHS